MPVTENSYMGWPLGMKGGQCYKSQVSSSLTKHLALYIVPGAMTVDVGGGRVFWGSSTVADKKNVAFFTSKKKLFRLNKSI